MGTEKLKDERLGDFFGFEQHHPCGNEGGVVLDSSGVENKDNYTNAFGKFLENEGCRVLSLTPLGEDRHYIHYTSEEEVA
tara:strand:+ start:16019 stop:16258 length:240 start_codon:yes stop_codon:yes gene_type:complete